VVGVVAGQPLVSLGVPRSCGLLPWGRAAQGQGEEKVAPCPGSDTTSMPPMRCTREREIARPRLHSGTGGVTQFSVQYAWDSH